MITMADKIVKDASPDWGGKRENSGRKFLGRTIDYRRRVTPEESAALDSTLEKLRKINS
jgi:hypothetical protein